ncbi:MAG: nucleotidyltransferase domain-containing protein, partial [Nitrosopumilaceae archaeon]|nr:nucleotidyltransferase domain-containing protein [Nitrosopumilaceae archaeon]
MKAQIAQLCTNFEKEKNVRIIFAVENGSRAWQMESADSDFDVRFVFVRPLKSYIQIHTPSEVLHGAFDKNFKPHPIQDSFIDFAGFDIFKFVKMVASSNPTTIEWLTTNIIYYGTQPEKLILFVKNHFHPPSLYHHYKSMCKQNYVKYLKSGNLVTYKKYLYAYRGLVNAKWIVHKNSPPPIAFPDALQSMNEHIPESILNLIKEIIQK